MAERRRNRSFDAEGSLARLRTWQTEIVALCGSLRAPASLKNDEKPSS
jgi:hypothetical protein